MSTDIKQNIANAISGFSKGNLFNNAIQLFSSLGYKTERQSRLSKNNYKGFIEDFPSASEKMNPKKTLTENWKSIELLFQLTQTEMTRQSFLFDTGKVDNIRVWSPQPPERKPVPFFMRATRNGEK